MVSVTWTNSAKMVGGLHKTVPGGRQGLLGAIVEAAYHTGRSAAGGSIRGHWGGTEFGTNKAERNSLVHVFW